MAEPTPTVEVPSKAAVMGTTGSRHASPKNTRSTPLSSRVRTSSTWVASGVVEKTRDAASLGTSGTCLPVPQAVRGLPDFSGDAAAIRLAVGQLGQRLCAHVEVARYFPRRQPVRAPAHDVV